MTETVKRVLTETEEMLERWVSALEGGQFRQAMDQLYGSRKNGYCCLGVAEKVLFEQSEEFEEEDRWSNGDLDGDKREVLNLNMVVTKEERKIISRYVPELNIDRYMERSTALANANDSRKLDFEQISQMIRELGWDREPGGEEGGS